MKLLLQPLIENSIYHGIKEKEGSGLIKIKLVRREDPLRVVVIANGCGIASDKLADVRRALQAELRHSR